MTTALGPILGGFLVENVSWRAAFLINVPLAIVVLLIAYRHVPESRDPDARKLDIPGAALATLGLGGVVYGLISSAKAGFDNLGVIVALVLGVGALVAFVAWERRAEEPMMPLSMFQSRNFSGANILTLLLYAGLGGALYFLPFLLIQVHEYSATAAGSSFLPFTIITFLMSRWAGGLITRYGARLPLTIGPVVAAAGFVLFALPGTEGSYWTTFFPAIVVLGLGMSLVIAPLTTTAMNSVSGSHSGLASGVNNAVSRTAGLLAIPILGIFVFLVFSGSLDDRVQNLDLSPKAQQQLEAEKVDLGGAEVPPGVSEETGKEIETAIEQSFLDAFRLAMFIAAGSALASAVAAAIIIEGKDRAAPAERGPAEERRPPREESSMRRLMRVLRRECTHLDQINDVEPSAEGCEECLQMGDTWVHLRECLICGHVGCCDSSKNKHATKHFHATEHLLVQSFQPDEDWIWCYVDEVVMEPAS